MPGIFKVWTLVAGDLHVMKLNVPRKFYVNLHHPDPEGARRRVTRALPRSTPCHNLYEFEMSETDFIERQRELSSYFTHPDMEGVYELQVQ